MIIRDIMVTNIVSIPSTTSLYDARKIMDAHRIRRLPVIDKGKLVGVVTKSALDRTGPSELTTFSMHELGYLLGKITVEKAMRRDVVTVSPDMNIEKAVALAQSKNVGALIVIEDERVVGVVTYQDIIYHIFNPILGIGMRGSRIVIRKCNKGPDIERVIRAINELKIGITNLFIANLPEAGKQELIVHLDTEDSHTVINEVTKLGCTVEEVSR